MSETMKTCSTCKYSYRAQDRSRHPSIGLLRQHCRNPRYNSPEYTSEIFEEDRKDNRCRFWAPMRKTMKNNYSVEERNRIVEEHLWCVKSVVNKYRAKIKAAGMEVEDIRQELSIRLIRAVEKYDPQTCELRDHIFSELNDELRLCMEPARAFGLTDAPQSIRGSAFVSLTRARNIPSMDMLPDDDVGEAAA